MWYSKKINKEKVMFEKEKGVAGMNIELADSVITVRHSETNKVLYKFNAIKGDWNKIWHFIKQLSK